MCGVCDAEMYAQQEPGPCMVEVRRGVVCGLMADWRCELCGCWWCSACARVVTSQGSGPDTRCFYCASLLSHEAAERYG